MITGFLKNGFCRAASYVCQAVSVQDSEGSYCWINTHKREEKPLKLKGYLVYKACIKTCLKRIAGSGLAETLTEGGWCIFLDCAGGLVLLIFSEKITTRYFVSL